MEWPVRWIDELSGPGLSEHWTGGHCNESREAQMQLKDDGLHIEFDEGREYASAGLLTREPLVGDFDARVRFHVARPGPGTTFELAALTVDPPRQSALDPEQANAFTRSRVYDVHGVPPYVSSEFDENDGWRIGWNRSAATGRTLPDGSVVSDNHFNRYGPDSGPRPEGAADGWLRLVRQGDDWRSYRLDEHGQWQTTGEVRAMNLPRAVFVRLAAKHWVKARDGLSIAPANRVRFGPFELRQPD